MTEEKKKKRGRVLVILIILVLLAVGVWQYLQYTRRTRERISAVMLKQIPLLQQGDYNETIAVFSGSKKSVATSGCGAVCLSMAIRYLTGQEVSPEALFQWAFDNKFYFGEGLGHDALSGMAEEYGLKGEWIDNEDLDGVREALSAGYPVVAHMGPGVFTRSGHYILLRGLDEEGMVLVNDPQSVPLSEGAYELENIKKELRRANSFMVISPGGGEHVESTDL